MTKEISTDVAEYLVVCYDKTIIGITQKAFEAIRSANPSKGFLHLKDGSVNISNVSKIMKRELYLEQHPETRKDWDERALQIRREKCFGTSN